MRRVVFFGVLGSLYAGGEDAETLPLGGSARRQLLAAVHNETWWATSLPSGSIVGYEPAADSGRVRFFTMPGRPQDWLGPACRLAGDTLTSTEWARYVGASRPYERVC